MDLQSQLKKLGLSHSEIAVYIFLLQNGLASPPVVSRGTKIARTNCYNVLNDLVEKGLVEELPEGKHKAYRAHDPEMLLHLLDVQKEAARRVLPELQGMYRSNKHKPKVEFYDGLEEVKKIFLLSLEAKAVLAVGAEHFLPALGDFYTTYLSVVAKRGIGYKVLPLVRAESTLPLQPPKSDGTNGQGGETPPLPPANEAMEDVLRETNSSHILIWADNVAFLTLDEPFFATVLTSEPIVRGLRLSLALS